MTLPFIVDVFDLLGKLKKNLISRYNEHAMESSELTKKTTSFLALFGLCFVVFGWFSLSLAMSNLFIFPFILIGAILTGGTGTFIAWKLLSRAPIDLRIVFFATLLYAALIGYISEPTLFSGRDQGSISEAAVRLSQTGGLVFSTLAGDAFFKIYGEGTAYNFPGFAYTADGGLITQFPLGYTSWLASFVTLFGIYGFSIGNAILLFLFLLTLYSLLRLFSHPFYAIAGLILAATSFLPIWFAKITLTENLGVFLFVFLVFNLVLFLREGKFIFYAGTLLSAGLFAFTRIEGFAFLALALIIMLFSQHTRAIWKAYFLKSVVLPASIFAFIFLRNFFINLPYYKMIGKALKKFLGGFGNDLVSSGSSLVAGNGALPVGSILFFYGLLILFIIGFFGLLIFLKERRFILLLPAFIALPTFLYLFSPNITPDYPWMLRRYLFSLFPTLLFSAVIGLGLLFSKERSLPLENPHGKRLFFVSIIFISLFLLQYPAWSSNLFFAENRGLREQVETFSQNFTNNDLILVDRFATGSGFSMLSGPTEFLYQKNTVYFFDAEKLADLDTSRFEHVYLLAPEESIPRYVAAFGDRLAFKKSITFSLEQFEKLSLSSEASLRLPEKTLIETHNTLFQIY